MKTRPTIWIFSLEPIDTRYTAQWHEHLPNLLKNNLGEKFNIVQIDGIQKNTKTTPGAFLNFSDTNFWKSSQLCNFLEFYNQEKTSSNDHFIFTDSWNPVITQIAYMKNLLGYNWKLHGLWHAGSYDPQDFLGRLIGDAPWVRFAEKSFFSAIDYNYFATDFHIDMFCQNLFECKREDMYDNKIIRTGWPMEYMEETLNPYKGLPKSNLILFPHRIAPEKQVDIFRDLAIQLPKYEFVVCQDQQLSKNEYHSLLGQAKIVFSANLQETLGISCYEGIIVNAIPMVPDRLSYSEMYFDTFKYPSIWTESFETYVKHRTNICDKINQFIDHYDYFLDKFIITQRNKLTEQFFNCKGLLENII